MALATPSPLKQANRRRYEGHQRQVMPEASNLDLDRGSMRTVPML